MFHLRLLDRSSESFQLYWSQEPEAGVGAGLVGLAQPVLECGIVRRSAVLLFRDSFSAG